MHSLADKQRRDVFYAAVAESVDALDLESSGAPLIRNRPVRVQIPPAAFSFHSMSKPSHTEGVPHPGNKIHIPLPEREAVRLLGKVKPTADMPRPGAQGTKRKKAQRRKPN
jgi:hypothetical protein